MLHLGNIVGRYKRKHFIGMLYYQINRGSFDVPLKQGKARCGPDWSVAHRQSLSVMYGLFLFTIYLLAINVHIFIHKERYVDLVTPNTKRAEGVILLFCQNFPKTAWKWRKFLHVDTTL